MTDETIAMYLGVFLVIALTTIIAVCIASTVEEL